MIRYGIILNIDDMFEIEAKKKRKNKETFMMELLLENMQDYSTKERNKILKGPNFNLFESLWNEGVMDELKELFFDPLSFTLTSNERESNIFIGKEEEINNNLGEDIMVPFSLIDQSIPPFERKRVNDILIEKGYGLYKCDFWLGLVDTIHTPYKSNEKLS